MEITKIVEALGGPGAIGRVCGVTRQAVCQWRAIPTRFVLTLAQHSTLTPHDMRPDLYPHRLDGVRGKVAPRTNGKRRR